MVSMASKIMWHADSIIVDKNTNFKYGEDWAYTLKTTTQSLYSGILIILPDFTLTHLWIFSTTMSVDQDYSSKKSITELSFNMAIIKVIALNHVGSKIWRLTHAVAHAIGYIKLRCVFCRFWQIWQR